MDDFTGPQDRFDKSAVRRGWLLVLVIMVAFVALTKIFPAPPAPQIADVAKPDR